jgi:hypothetical protein
MWYLDKELNLWFNSKDSGKFIDRFVYYFDVTKNTKKNQMSKLFNAPVIKYKFCPIAKCELCEVVKDERYIPYLSLKINKQDSGSWFIGSFCLNCANKIRNLKDCYDLLREIKKEIKNVKKDTNSRAIKRIFVRHDVRC